MMSSINLDQILARRQLTRNDLNSIKIGEKQLNRFALRVRDWKSCAALLPGIDQQAIDDIDEEHKKVKHKRIALFYLWRQRNGEDATYMSLVKVLLELEDRHLIEFLIDDVYVSRSPTRYDKMTRYKEKLSKLLSFHCCKGKITLASQSRLYKCKIIAKK